MLLHRHLLRVLRRPPGLLVLSAVVLAGLGSGNIAYLSQATKVEEEAPGVIKRLRALPSDSEEYSNEQLTAWLEFGEPMIQHRLTQLSFGPRAPWLVTHTADGDEGDEVWGIPMVGPRPARFEREGLQVRIHLPAPYQLGSGVLYGDNADRVPHYPEGAPEGAAVKRAKELMEWFLKKIISALPEDITGASIEILIDEAPTLLPHDEAPTLLPQEG